MEDAKRPKETNIFSGHPDRIDPQVQWKPSSVQTLHVAFPRGQCASVSKFVKAWAEIVDTTPEGYRHCELHVKMPKMMADCPELYGLDNHTSVSGRVAAMHTYINDDLYTQFILRPQPAALPQ